MSDHLDPENEDASGYTFPTKASELRSLPDDRLFRLWRKVAFENLAGHAPIIEQEMTTRLIISLGEFRRAADRSSRTLNVLTAVLVVLTAVLVVYAVRAR